MSAASSARTWSIRLLLVTIGVCLALGLFEVALRLSRPAPVTRSPPTPLICGDCPQIYELNPKHVGVSAQGFRDREFSLTPPDGTFRIAVLGDSVSYGLTVAPTAVFPKILETKLTESGARVEVINAGVPAYTPYNEWQLYLAKVRKYHPKLVLVSFCMNDVVDPTTHWMRLISPAIARNVPKAAVPNPEHHRTYAMQEFFSARSRQRSRVRNILRSSVIFQRLEAYLDTPRPKTSVTAGGKRFVAWLSGEDTTSIEVLADYDSVEWTWLRGIYDQLNDAVKADGATLGLIVNPLLYQLDADYPVSVAPAFARYCAERKIPCFDLLPTMREHAAEHPFIGENGEVLDIWHYNSTGHRIAGEALANMVRTAGLVPSQGAK